TDDFTSNPIHPGSVTVGGTASGNIEHVGDKDWFAVTLTAGQNYEIEETGLSEGAQVQIGQAADLESNDAFGIFATGASEDGQSPLANFTPTSTGPYYIGVEDPLLVPASYSLSASDVNDDFTSNTIHPGQLSAALGVTDPTYTLPPDVADVV